MVFTAKWQTIGTKNEANAKVSTPPREAASRSKLIPIGSHVKVQNLNDETTVTCLHPGSKKWL